MYSLGPAREALIKQLTWEGASTAACNAIMAICNEDIHKWITAAKDMNPMTAPLEALTASSQTLVIDRQPSQKPSWVCSQLGHFHYACPR